MRLAAALVVLAACTTPPSDDDGYYISVAISSPVAFDHLDVAWMIYGASEPAAIVTPDVLASGAQPPPGRVFSRVPGRFVEGTHASAATTDVTLDRWELTTSYEVVFAIAHSGSTFVGAGVTTPTYVWNGSAHHADASLELSPDAELWGLLHDDCVRVGGYYLTDAAAIPVPPSDVPDSDCDAIPDPEDCRPDVYCDPTATDPAGMAACRCTKRDGTSEPPVLGVEATP